jgi:hypothetical protein
MGGFNQFCFLNLISSVPLQEYSCIQLLLGVTAITESSEKHVTLQIFFDCLKFCSGST